jgi:hypothetical protein
MPRLDLSQTYPCEPCDALSSLAKTFDHLHPSDTADDEISLYGRCTNPVMCDETNIKRGDNRKEGGAVEKAAAPMMQL